MGTYYQLLLPFKDLFFPGEPWSYSTSLGPAPPPVLKKNLWGLAEQGFLWVECHQTISIQAPKETQSTNRNQWPGLILIYNWTPNGYLMPNVGVNFTQILADTWPQQASLRLVSKVRKLVHTVK